MAYLYRMKKLLIISLLMLCSCADGRFERAFALIGGGRAAHSPFYTNVYRGCTGTVINGICHGNTVGLPTGRCYGTMLNGQCVGSLLVH